MNKRLNLLKENLKEHLSKRINCNVNDISFFSIPYSINLIGEGIEDYVPNLINIALGKICLIGFIETNSENINIYDYNKNKIYEISPTKTNKIKDEYSSILIATYNSIKAKKNVGATFTACFYDDFHSTSLSSPAIKFALFLNAISKTNKINLYSQLFTSILNDTSNILLNTRIDINELLSFKNSLSDNENMKTEKLNWSIFNDIKVLQISFKEKRVKTQVEKNFFSELNESFNLLRVLMASSRKKKISDFASDEIKSFARRTSPEKQLLIEYLYDESKLIEESISALKLKDMDNFINSIKLSDQNLSKFGLIDNKIEEFSIKIRKITSVLASKISIKNNSLTLLVNRDSENLIREKIDKEITQTLSESRDEIQLYSSLISGIHIYELEHIQKF